MAEDKGVLGELGRSRLGQRFTLRVWGPQIEDRSGEGSRGLCGQGGL